MTDTIGTYEQSPARVRMDPPRTFRRVPLLPHQMRDEITPQRDLFVLAHVGVPRLDAQRWSLTVDGLVRERRQFTLGDIRRLPKIEVQSVHQCAGYPQDPTIATRRVGNVVWGGADLKTVLGGLGIAPQARFLWAYGADRGAYEGIPADPYLKDCPLSRVDAGGVLLAYEVNGEPLDAEHGFPLRLVVPGFYGTNCVKWLTRLHLAETRAGGPFTTTLYNDRIAGDLRPVWEIAPESVIVSPAPHARVGGEIEIWGWAWADGGVAKVEVSTDGGAHWCEAQLGDRHGWSWQKFRFMWTADRAGEVLLMSRATSKRGEVQPASGWRNCVYPVPVRVA
ncbi:MAG TPA: molybdopterin-dependent oxidoreductase [Pseudolabrys sp.]|nr:molybdopterin-dependent oxidoreductase [Pseudolabrys sp.]